MISEFKNKEIAVLCGGNSQERSVSIRSGNNVYKALKSLGYKTKLIDPSHETLSKKTIDVAFIALHGPGYEDGSLQKILEQEKIPYTGCGIDACEISMNKYKTKMLCLNNDLPVPKFKYLRKPKKTLDHSFNFPVIIKPILEGSSIDVYIIDNNEQLHTYSSLLTN